MSPIAQSIIRPVIIRSVKQIFYISMRVFVLAHKPVHWIWTQSVLVISIRLGTKSYSTDGYTWTMFPRFPRTLRLYIWHVSCRRRQFRARPQLHDVGAVLEGAAKLRRVDGEPQWLVRRGANVNVGVLGHRGTNTRGTVCREQAHVVTHRIPQRNEIVTYNDTKGVI